VSHLTLSFVSHSIHRQSRKIPDALKALVGRCWDADYDKRPEMTEVIAELQQVLAVLPPDTSIAAQNSQCCVVQ
jgi:hypothetical protein